jgi:hypothetical protein
VDRPKIGSPLRRASLARGPASDVLDASSTTADNTVHNGAVRQLLGEPRRDLGEVPGEWSLLA